MASRSHYIAGQVVMWPQLTHLPRTAETCNHIPQRVCVHLLSTTARSVTCRLFPANMLVCWEFDTGNECLQIRGPWNRTRKGISCTQGLWQLMMQCPCCLMFLALWRSWLNIWIGGVMLLTPYDTLHWLLSLRPLSGEYVQTLVYDIEIKC